MNMPHSQDQTHLSVRNVSKRFGRTDAVVDASLNVARGETLALLGPSGCGKTTLLRVIAGLESPDRGEVHIGGTVVAGPGRSVPPRHRGVGLVFQNGALFPHMSVLDNVAFGLGDDPDLDVARRALERVDLPGLDDRMPDSLSGGERQRVALARAIAPEPAVLLLDEPLGSLDADRRVRIRTEISALLAALEITAVFVTHDQEEAFVIGDHVAVMRNGAILQVGPPSEIYDLPVDEWVARFVGDANIVPAVGHGAYASTWLGDVPLKEAHVGACTLVIRPEYLVLDAEGTGRIEGIEYYGHDTSYTARFADDLVDVRRMSAPVFGTGDAVSIRYDGPPAPAFSGVAG